MKSTQQSYSDLKSSFVRYSRKNGVKTVMFVGGSSSDGVSTTALGFSRALAAGSPGGVVLINANLRSPLPYRDSHLNAASNKSNLVDILLWGKQASPVKIENSNLYFISCGDSCSSPQAMFEDDQPCQPMDDMKLHFGDDVYGDVSRNGFNHLMDDLTSRFDYVVVDAPPVLSAPESLCIAANVDVVVLVLESGVTRREVARKTIEKIEEAEGKVLGIVLNKRKYYIPERMYKFFFGH
jgi:protein-tyrosine kinase